MTNLYRCQNIFWKILSNLFFFKLTTFFLGRSSIWTWNLEFRMSNICFDFFKCASKKNNNKYLKFDTSKSMSYQGYLKHACNNLEEFKFSINFVGSLDETNRTKIHKYFHYFILRFWWIIIIMMEELVPKCLSDQVCWKKPTTHCPNNLYNIPYIFH